MPFQIHALAPEPFQPFFSMAPEALKAHHAELRTVTEHPGIPCRISLADAEIGERVLLINHTHLPDNSPYRASHAIYVRQNAKQAQLAPGEVPEILCTRLLSLRGFDENAMILEADVVEGRQIAPAIEKMFENPDVKMIHLHNARHGCFAASVTRA